MVKVAIPRPPIIEQLKSERDRQQDDQGWSLRSAANKGLPTGPRCDPGLWTRIPKACHQSPPQWGVPIPLCLQAVLIPRLIKRDQSGISPSRRPQLAAAPPRRNEPACWRVRSCRFSSHPSTNDRAREAAKSRRSSKGDAPIRLREFSTADTK